MGKHSVKFGADYRRHRGGNGARQQRQLRVHAGVHAGAEPQHGEQRPPATRSPASCSAIPATGDVNVATPGEYYTDYYSAFVQDDYRVTPTLTLNCRAALRVRARHRGRRTTSFTVGFDRQALFPGAGAGHGTPRRADVCRRRRQSDAAGQTAQQRRAARRLRLVGDRQDGDSRRLRALLGAADQRHRRVCDRCARLLGVDYIPVEH